MSGKAVKLTEEERKERKERKKQYDIEYMKRRYRVDPEFKEMKKRLGREYYHRTKVLVGDRNKKNIEVEEDIDHNEIIENI